MPTGLFQEMPAEAEYMANLTARVAQEIEARDAATTPPAPMVMLQSPGGSVYAVYRRRRRPVDDGQGSGGG